MVTYVIYQDTAYKGSTKILTNNHVVNKGGSRLSDSSGPGDGGY